jgi:hypothetical protein
MSHTNALATIYVEACRRYRSACVSGEDGERAIFGDLCLAIETAYPSEVRAMRDYADEQHAPQAERSHIDLDGGRHDERGQD